MYRKTIKLFLRFAIAGGFLSAVADRFGIWTYHIAWGNWNNFVEYTQVIIPWFSGPIIQAAAIVATALEVVLAVCLLLGFKTELAAKLSGILLLLFALTMTFSTGIKTSFDASVYAASAAAFALGLIKEKFLELDSVLYKKRGRMFY